MRGTCLTCGRHGRVERHHVAGRANHDVTVPVCSACHRVLSGWQRTSGVLLGPDRPGESRDVPYALLAGVLDVLRLALARAGHAGDAALVARTTADVAGALGVPLPAPGLADPVEVEPVPPDEDPRQREIDLVALAVTVVRAAVPDAPWADRLRSLDPGRLVDLLTGPSRWPALLDRAAGDLRTAVGYLARNVGAADSPVRRLVALLVGLAVAVDAAVPFLDVLDAAAAASGERS